MLIAFSLIKQYVLEEYMSRSKDSLHGRAYARLKPRDQRTLVNHHISLFMKLALLVVGTSIRLAIIKSLSPFWRQTRPPSNTTFAGVYPFCALVSGHNFNSRFIGKSLTIGDVLFLCSNTYTAVYMFELCYRQGISYITWLQCVYPFPVTDDNR